MKTAAFCILALCLFLASARCQMLPPPQGWPGVPAPAIVQGSSLAGTLRNAVQSVSDQVRAVSRQSADLNRKARTSSYQMQNLVFDYQNLLAQYQNLCAGFNQAAALVDRLQSPRASNAAAELGAGLDIIAQVFTPAQQELQYGSLNRQTVANLSETLNLALSEWHKELKKNSSRLGMIR